MRRRELMQVVHHWPGVRRAPQAQRRREHDPACGEGLLLSLDTDAGQPWRLVLVLRPPGAVGACQLLRKGPDRFALDCVLSFQALLSEARRRRSHKTLVRVPPNHSHQSNVLVGNAVRRVESLVRTFVAELKARLSVKIGASAHILPCVLTRFIVKADGRITWARLRRREYTNALATIGETVDFKLVQARVATTRATISQEYSGVYHIPRCSVEPARCAGGGAHGERQEALHNEGDRVGEVRHHECTHTFAEIFSGLGDVTQQTLSGS